MLQFRTGSWGCGGGAGVANRLGSGGDQVGMVSGDGVWGMGMESGEDYPIGNDRYLCIVLYLLFSSA